MKIEEYIKYRIKRVSHRNVAETAIRLEKNNKNKTWNHIEQEYYLKFCEY